jgi:hypothetical protein
VVELRGGAQHSLTPRAPLRAHSSLFPSLLHVLCVLLEVCEEPGGYRARRERGGGGFSSAPIVRSKEFPLVPRSTWSTSPSPLRPPPPFPLSISLPPAPPHSPPAPPPPTSELSLSLQHGGSSGPLSRCVREQGKWEAGRLKGRGPLRGIRGRYFFGFIFSGAETVYLGG